MSETRADYDVSMPSWNGAEDFIGWCIDNGVDIEPHTDGTVSSGVPPRLGHLQGTIASVVDQHADELRCFLLGIPSKLPPPYSGSSSNQVIGYSGTQVPSGTQVLSGPIRSLSGPIWSEGDKCFLNERDWHEIDIAIGLTVGMRFGGKDDALWRFVRMVLFTLRGQPLDVGMANELAARWFLKFDQSDRPKKIGFGEFCSLFDTKLSLVKDPDFEFGGWCSAQDIQPPWFVERLALVNRDDPYVWLGRLVVAMSELSDDGTWILTCRHAAEFIGRGLNKSKVSFRLIGWTKQGVLELVHQGSGSGTVRDASIYRLVERFD